MVDRILAELVLVLHLLFIVFVVLGGLLCLKRAVWAWVHIPAAIWGVWVEWSGTICPLTPLENSLRRAAATQGYSGGFIDHYLVPIIYPAGLHPTAQWVLGALALTVNVIVYLVVILRRKRTLWSGRN